MIHMPQFLDLEVNQNLEEARKHSGIDYFLKPFVLALPQMTKIYLILGEGLIKASIIF